jgi:hypothetical protein
MAKLKYDGIVDQLRARKTTMRCDELVGHLEELGFIVRKGNNGKHHTFSHPKLAEFAGNFDCGHGRNPQVLPVYIGKVIKQLEKYESELR